MIFYNFCYYFWGQHFWWTETNIIDNDFFVFYKFLLPSTVLLLPAASATLNTHVVSTTSPIPAGAKPPLENFSSPLEKCVGYGMKILHIFRKIWASLRKLFAPPGVQSWLRAWSTNFAKTLVANLNMTSYCDVTNNREYSPLLSIRLW